MRPIHLGRGWLPSHPLAEILFLAGGRKGVRSDRLTAVPALLHLIVGLLLATPVFGEKLAGGPWHQPLARRCPRRLGPAPPIPPTQHRLVAGIQVPSGRSPLRTAWRVGHGSSPR